MLPGVLEPRSQVVECVSSGDVNMWIYLQSGCAHKKLIIQKSCCVPVPLPGPTILAPTLNNTQQVKIKLQKIYDKILYQICS